MARYKLLVSYDGTDFCGWQRQAAHKHAPPRPSIQETMEKALGQILNHEVIVSASGRTDAGVHAAAQICHFDSDVRMPKDLCWALRGRLPHSIVVKKAWIAPPEFHSTLSAVRKTYRYWIYNKPRASALLHRYSWWIRNPLNLEFLNETSSLLLGEQDFESFRSMGTPVKHSVRRIEHAHWSLRRNGLLEFQITGNGFMKQMVRNIVGTLVDLEQDDEKPQKIREIMALRDRKVAGQAAPPQGLLLVKVQYPKSLDKKCLEI